MISQEYKLNDAVLIDYGHTIVIGRVVGFSMSGNPMVNALAGQGELSRFMAIVEGNDSLHKIHGIAGTYRKTTFWERFFLLNNSIYSYVLEENKQ